MLHVRPSSNNRGFGSGSSSRPFSSMLVQSLLILLGITIAVHHLLLTSPILKSMMGATSDGDMAMDAPSTTQRSLLGGIGELSLEALSGTIGHSSHLSAAEKEQLLSTIQQLAQQKKANTSGDNNSNSNSKDNDNSKDNSNATVVKASVTAPTSNLNITASEIDINAPIDPATMETITTLTPKNPYAYMFVIGGIHEDRPAYKGFLYDVLVAARLLQKLGSTADVVLFTQMSPDSSHDGLLPEELAQLAALHIQVITLPKPSRESFAGLVFEKFRALQMIQYRRVIFLDADAIPLANLDYMFHLSDPLHTTTPTFLRPNMIWATRGEPCNAGLFMLQPEAGAWEQLHRIIQRQKAEGREMDYPHFSWKRGWGYDFEAEQDEWHGTVRNGVKWRFHAGHSDQGLLYYWAKFFKRNVSIIIQDKVENWIDAGKEANMTIDGMPKPKLEMNLKLEPLAPYSHENPMVHQFNCNEDKHVKAAKHAKPHQCVVPYRDIAHFMGGSKPWMVQDPKNHRKRRNSQKYVAAINLWFDILEEINAELEMGLDFHNWHEKHDIKEAPLGLMAKFSDIAKEHHGEGGEQQQQQQKQDSGKKDDKKQPVYLKDLKDKKKDEKQQAGNSKDNKKKQSKRQ